MLSMGLNSQPPVGPMDTDSENFQVSMVEMLARLEIFLSYHCGIHFAQYFPDGLVFFCFVFVFVWIFCLPEGISWCQPIRSELLHLNNGLLLSVGEDNFALIDATALSMAFDSCMKITTTGTEIAKATSLSPVNWAVVWQVTLFFNFQPNIPDFGIRSSLASSTSLLIVFVCKKKKKNRSARQYWHIDTCSIAYYINVHFWCESENQSDNSVSQLISVSGSNDFPVSWSSEFILTMYSPEHHMFALVHKQFTGNQKRRRKLAWRCWKCANT